MIPLQVSVNMFHREHDRWHQWALFFFGAVVSVFLLWGNLKPVIPLWVPALVATFLSLCWVMIALNIRASTHTWRAVAMELERDPSGNGMPFAMYELKSKEFSRRQDLKKTLTYWRTETFLSVTRVMTLLGVVSALLFSVLAFLAFFGFLVDPVSRAVR